MAPAVPCYTAAPPAAPGQPRWCVFGGASPEFASGPPRVVRAMKLTIERAALLEALGHVQSVVERRTTIPILSNVLLRAEAGRLALSATDMDLEIVERVAARVEREGRTTAPAHTLYD